MNHYKNIAGYFIISLMLISSFYERAIAKNEGQTRQRLLMDFNLKFQLGDKQGAEQTSFDDGKLKFQVKIH